MEIKEVNRIFITFKNKLKIGFKIVKVFHIVVKIFFTMCPYKKYIINKPQSYKWFKSLGLQKFSFYFIHIDTCIWRGKLCVIAVPDICQKLFLKIQNTTSAVTNIALSGIDRMFICKQAICL